MPIVEDNFLPVLKFERERKGGATLELVHDVLRGVFSALKWLYPALSICLITCPLHTQLPLL